MQSASNIRRVLFNEISKLSSDAMLKQFLDAGSASN